MTTKNTAVKIPVRVRKKEAPKVEVPEVKEEELKEELTTEENVAVEPEETAEEVTPAEADIPEAVEEEPKVEEVEEPKVEKADTSIGSLKGGKKVYQAVKTVRMQAFRGAIDKTKLPVDIQKWLTNKGYGTNVYMKDKEWLEKHHVNMEMVEKLKKFINDNYL